MSTPPVTPPPAPAGTIRCPRCQGPVVRAQDWCLQCGAPARTRLAPAPNWRLPVVAVATLAAVAAIVLVIAFVALTDSPPQTGTTSTTAATAPLVAPTGAAGPTGAVGATGTPGPTGGAGAAPVLPGPGATTPVDPSTPPSG